MYVYLGLLVHEVLLSSSGQFCACSKSGGGHSSCAHYLAMYHEHQVAKKV
jgi:hypothetical protein